jgi:hypothetical protein
LYIIEYLDHFLRRFAAEEIVFPFDKSRDILRHKGVELHQGNSHKNKFVPFLHSSDITKRSERRKAKFKINLITVVSSSAQELKAADK